MMKAGGLNEKAAEDCRTPKPGGTTLVLRIGEAFGLRQSSAALASALLSVFALFTQSLRAELPVARLASIFPAGGQAGSTVEVTVAGVDLDDLSGLVFSHTNITAITNKSSSSTFFVSIGSNVPPGIYDARVTGRYGVSNPRAFAISDQRELVEAAGNSEREKAMELAVDTVVNGRTDPNAADYFKFAIKSHQRVLVECAAGTIDSRCRPVLVLYDASGRELVRSRRGELLDFTAAADMTAILKLHDVVFRGGPAYHYRLSVSSKPHIDFVLPSAALAGTTNKHVIYGRNLSSGQPSKDMRIDGQPLEELTVDIAAPSESSAQNTASLRAIQAGPIAGFEYRLNTSNGLSNPFYIAFATAPVTAESEPNTQPDQAQKLTLPCEVTGQFYPANDRDWFSFDAKKGDAYWIEVFSERLGYPTDPFLLIQRVATNGQPSDVQEVYDADAVSAGNDLKIGARDPAFRFEVKEDGTYRAQVRDLFNRVESDPGHLYRLSIRKDAPDFSLVAFPETPPPAKQDSKDVPLWSTLLRRGDTVPLRVVALRRGYNDDIRLAVEGLPAGVKVAQTNIPSGKNWGLLLLTAAEDIKAWTGRIYVVGHGSRAGQEISRRARGAMLMYAVEDKTRDPLERRLTDDTQIAITEHELAPLSIATAEDKVYASAPGAKLSIPLKITRRGDFTEAFKLKPAGASAIEGLKEIDVPANGTNAVIELDLAKQKFAPGEHSFFVQTQTKGKYRRNPEAIPPAEQLVKAAEKAVGDLAGEIKKAEATAASSSADAKAAAEKSVADMKVKLKEAEAQKSAADATLKQVTEKAKPQELNLTVYSAPIRLNVPEEKKVAATQTTK